MGRRRTDHGQKATIEELDISQLNYGGRIRLIKLHGSTNWYKLQSGKIVKSDTQRIRIGGEIVEGELMIYPISQKNLYLYPWLDFIKQFKNDLRLCKNWLVIGYSFNDQFITQIFLEEIAKGGHQLVMVNPDAPKIMSKKLYNYQDFVKNVTQKFGKKDISSSILTLVLS